LKSLPSSMLVLVLLNRLLSTTSLGLESTINQFLEVSSFYKHVVGGIVFIENLQYNYPIAIKFTFYCDTSTQFIIHIQTCSLEGFLFTIFNINSKLVTLPNILSISNNTYLKEHSLQILWLHVWTWDWNTCTLKIYGRNILSILWYIFLEAQSKVSNRNGSLPWNIDDGYMPWNVQCIFLYSTFESNSNHFLLPQWDITTFVDFVWH